MKEIPFIFILIIVIPLFFMSCLYKSVKRGKADSVYRSSILEREGEFYLLNFESLFQASSKEYNKGTMTIHGHYDHRISVYQIGDGTLLARQKVKGRMFPFVGMCKNVIWLYDKKKGIYGLDDFTLEQKYSVQDILSSNPDRQFSFVKPKYNEIWDYYKMDNKSGDIILTDMQGRRYSMNTESLVLSPFEGEIKRDPWADLPDPRTIRNVRAEKLELEGDLRKKLFMKGSDILQGESFIDAEFAYTGKSEYISEDAYVFIIHRDSLEEKAKLCISCVKKEAAGNYTRKWTVLLEELFFNTDMARGSSFKRTFSKGNPDYSGKFFAVAGDNLCFIYMLHAGAVDLESGELLWIRRL